MDNNQELLAKWDDAAKELDNDSMRPIRYAKCFRYIKELNRASRILEIGCGEGTGLRILKSLGFTNIVGVEVSRKRLIKVHSKMGNTESILLTSPDNFFPFIDASFDVIISAGVIEHTKDPKGFIREIKRLLRPNEGLIIISSDCYQWRILQIFGIYKSIQPIDKAIFPSQLIKLFKRSDFYLVHCEGFPLPNQEFRFFRLPFYHIFGFFNLIIHRLVSKISIIIPYSLLNNINNKKENRSVPVNIRNSYDIIFTSIYHEHWKKQNIFIVILKLVFSDENVFFFRRRSKL